MFGVTFASFRDLCDFLTQTLTLNLIFSCFAVYVLANNTRVVPYFESCMASLILYHNLVIIDFVPEIN